MPEDRGGLNYRLDVTNDWRTELGAFKQELIESKETVTAIRAEAAKTRKALADMANANKAFATSQKAAATASSNASKAAAKQTSSSRELAKVRAQLIAQEKQLTAKTGDPQTLRLTKRVALLKQIQSLQKAINAKDNQELVALRQREKAVKAITAAEDRRVLASDKAVKNARTEATIAEQVAKNQQAFAVAKDRQVANSKVRLSVERQIAAFEEKQARFARLAAIAKQRGLAGNQQALSDLGINQGRARSLGLLPEIATAKGQADISAATQGLEGLDKAQQRAQKSGFSLTGTMKRLFAIFVGYRIISEMTRAVSSLLREMVRFNAFIETAVLGITSLFISVGTITDATGQAVTGLEAFRIAEREATRQTKLLRVEALRTAASFEELLFSFQTAVGPGLAAGLDSDAIRNISVSIAKAAGAIGLEQNQLPEEIRSLFQGTITPRNTRIATLLGITNDDIRRAKEAGRLADFLTERFAGFEAASEVAQGTFAVLLSNLGDGLQQLAGEGGIEFFDALKAALLGIQDSLVQDTGDGIVVLNPDAVGVVKAIASGLASAVRSGQDLIRSLDPASLESAARVIGDVIAVVAELSAEVIEGIAAGIGDLSTVLQIVTGLISGLEGTDGGIFGEETVSTVARLLTILLSIATVSKVITSFTKKTSLLFKAFRLVLAPVGVLFTAISLKALLIGAAVTAVVVSVAAIVQAIIEATGSTAKLADVLSATLGFVVEAFNGLALLIGDLTSSIVGLVDRFAKFTGFVKDEDVKNAQSLTDAYENFVSSTAIGLSNTKKTAEQIQNLREETDKIVDSAFFDLAGIGPSGETDAFAALDIEQQKRVLKETKTVAEEITQLYNQMAEISTRQTETVARNRSASVGDDREQILTILSLVYERENAEKAIVDLESKKLELQEAFAKAKASENKELQSSILEQARAANRELDTQRQIRDTAIDKADKYYEIVDVSETARAAAFEELELNKQLEKTIGNIAEQEKDLLQIQKELSDQYAAQLSVLRKRETIQSANRERDTRNEIESIRANTGLILTEPDPNDIFAPPGVATETGRLTDRQRSIRVAEQEIKFLKQQREIDLEINQNRVDRAIQTQRALASQGASYEDIKEQAGLVRALEEEKTTQYNLQTIQLGVQQDLIEESKDKASDALQELADIFDELDKTIVAGLGDSLVQIFDPEYSGNPWQDFLGYLGDLGRQIASLIIQALILRAVFGSSGTGGLLGGLFAGGAAEGGMASDIRPVGLAAGGRPVDVSRGGKVPNRPAPAALRPSYLDSRDKVPAFLDPTEFVVRGSVVEKPFVQEFLESLNNGLINPLDVKALIPMQRRIRSRVSSAVTGIRGMVDGGLAGAGGSSSTAGMSGSPSTNVLPILPLNEDLMEQLINSGRAPLREFIQETQGSS